MAQGRKDVKDIGNPNVLGHEDGWGLVVRFFDPDLPGMSTYDGKPVSLKDSRTKSDAKFIESALSAKVGFPLKAARYPSMKGKYHNYVMRMVFCEPNPTSPNFLWPVGIEMETGDMVVVRMDGQPITNMQFEPFFCFIKHASPYLDPPLFNMKEGEAKEERKRKIVQKLTPEAFHTWFESYRRLQVRNGRSVYKGVASPLLTTFGPVSPACGHCLLKGEPEKPLLSCAKCKVRSYCSRACQKEDWKEHKLVCGME